LAPCAIIIGEKSSCRLPFVAQLAQGILLTAVFWARQGLKKILEKSKILSFALMCGG